MAAEPVGVIKSRNNTINGNVAGAKSSKKAPNERKEAKKEPSLIEHVLFYVYVIGVWTAFLSYSWTQEALAKEDFDGKKFHFTHTQVFLQSSANMLVALVAICLETWYKSGDFTLNAGVNLKHWLIASLGYQGAHFFGLHSLHYVSFPVQIVIKSCKTVPVLIGEVLIAGEKATLKKCVSVVILSLGVILFLFFKPSKKKGIAAGTGDDEFEMTSEFFFGLFMILLALICDGIYGPYQSFIKNTYEKCGAFHLMFNMNLWQGIFSFLFALGDGELMQFLGFVQQHPSVIPYLINFCASMAIGSSFIYLLQRSCGALTVTKTTTVRKLFSVLFSAFYFGHTISAVQWIGVVVVFSTKFTAPMVAGQMSALLGFQKQRQAKQKIN
eukprot:CAMPEP_0184479992 /NCGR_PEP_ID=MMETSP0113_2-20130426/1490_1 /TAXON_ID=91329 /ORGANISM="Norrisiella sphaerica, Strain BC52" /LENGTH=382 /DNA_ID=CAMNT_0026858173 /DNA_START=86 /DNA_END=1234 /DNA_ORIENTATION=+